MQSTNGRDGLDRLPEAADYYQTHDISQEMEAGRGNATTATVPTTSDLLIRGSGFKSLQRTSTDVGLYQDF